MQDELNQLQAELAKREMARRWFADYLPIVHGKNWKQTRMSQYLANEVQAFASSVKFLEKEIRDARCQKEIEF